jgi:hypothetical protein
MTPTVVIVGADKGGVGKTMTCRVLLDYLTRGGKQVRAFDTESPAGNLVRFYPADVVDITKVRDQMRIFDGVTEGVITVVDIRAGVLSPTIKALDDAKLLDEVGTGSMKLVLIHVLGDTVASIAEITHAANAIGQGAKHFLVKNKTNPDQSFDWDSPSAKAALADMADVTINIDALPAVAANETDARGGSFVDFCTDPAQSKTLRGLVGRWVDKVEAEFDRVKLLDA